MDSKFSSKSSKKRVFSEGSSSDPNVVEISPRSAKQSSNQKVLKNKKVNEDHKLLMKFQEFKKFDIVQDPSDHYFLHQRTSTSSDHYFLHQRTSTKQPSKSLPKKIHEEWKNLKKNLPDTILVRAYESRMDLLRAVIVGADKTSYHDGLFFFDVFFPDDYPNVPPHVYHHSHGLQLNPNLDKRGDVCISLLRGGNRLDSWIPNVSNMLQVLVSIQGLVLNAKPYFNDPMLAHIAESISKTEALSLKYNENAFLLFLKTMVFILQHQPKHFEDFVVGHFFIRAKDILVACKAYIDGAQIGCLAQGGVQDVDEGDKSCSNEFRASLSEYINVIVDAFTHIDVKDCEQFIRV